MTVFKGLKQLIDSQSWLDSVGDPLQSYINSLFAENGQTGKEIQNFLNGVWLGHPLHPVLTDVPVGAWTCTLALDSIASLSDNESLEAAADITLATGLAAGVASAITGLTDWKDTWGDERKVGLAHGLTMTTAVAGYSLALLLRLAGARKTGVALSNLAYGLTALGAYVGGDEVFDIGYPVNHTAFQHGPGDYVEVMPEADLPEGQPQKVDARGVSVVLVKQGGAIYALHDTCVHAGCSLSGGTVEGRSIICPCHGSQYDLADGSVIHGPATMPEPHFDVRVQNGTIEVKQAPV